VVLRQYITIAQIVRQILHNVTIPVVVLLCIFYFAISFSDFPPPINMTNIDTVRNYMRHRIAKDTTQLLALCTSDISLDSQTPLGTTTAKGKTQFGAYLNKQKPEGDWEAPKEEGRNTVTVVGLINKIVIKLKVKATFHLVNGKIDKLILRTTF
jgi:hypothetical protein